MGGGSSLSLGVVSCGRWLVVLIVGGGRPLWVLGVVRGAGSLFLGAGLSIVGAGARSRERVVHVAAGFSVWARWCRVVCWLG